MNIEVSENLPFYVGYYEGDIVDGKPHGKGEYHNLVKEWDYKGDFVEGKMTGTGRLEGRSFDLIYEGDFVDGKFHGKGKLRDEGCIYEGDFADGFFHGKGKMTYPNGRVEEGNWKYGKLIN
jgi:hypothetical protein